MPRGIPAQEPPSYRKIECRVNDRELELKPATPESDLAAGSMSGGAPASSESCRPSAAGHDRRLSGRSSMERFGSG